MQFVLLKKRPLLRVLIFFIYCLVILAIEQSFCLQSATSSLSSSLFNRISKDYNGIIITITIIIIVIIINKNKSVAYSSQRSYTGQLDL
jgi:hypothetical protein